MSKKNLFVPHLGLLLAMLAVTPAPAATSFSNTLRGFTGDSSLAATQTAVAAGGFNFASTALETAVVFDANGANFGAMSFGDSGRNYMRSVQSDYATVSFIAEVTMAVPALDLPPYQSGWLGIGAGDIATFGWPDWDTQFSSAMVVSEKFDDSRFFTTMFMQNGDEVFSNNPIPVLENGTHRLRLQMFADLAIFSIDLNYAGGAFVEDYRAPALNVSGLYAADGWPMEPSRIYFGGDDGTLFKDFQVTVDGPRARFGDLNADGSINALDWNILRSNQETNLSGLSLKNAYLRGDLNLDLANEHADFQVFKTVYEQENGPGSFEALLAVPEPSAIALLLSAGLFGMAAAHPANHSK